MNDYETKNEHADKYRKQVYQYEQQEMFEGMARIDLFFPERVHGIGRKHRCSQYQQQ